MFDYDRTIPLQVQESSAEKRGAAIVHDLSYASPTLGRVSAYLTEPAEKSRCPAIIFLHWGQGDRATFLSEALAYAESGVESLLVDESPLRHFPMPNQMTSDGARAYVVQCVTDLRRGVDLLVSRKEVDSDRIGYVGHSLGASMGGQFAGVEKRVMAHILMAGYADMSQHLAKMSQRYFLTSGEEFLRVAGPLDGVNFVGDAAPSAILFQFALRDEVITKEDADLYFNAARQPKEIRWYDVGHEFNQAALSDRAAWLGEKLGFRPPDANRLNEVRLPQRDVEFWRAAAPVLRAGLQHSA
jgi:cephalosporin-C deacetylase-like acetyl esterase